MKSPQRELVEAHYRNAWPTTDCPTDGFARSCLALLGINTTGKDMTRSALIKLCNDNGLPFVEKAAKDNRNTSDR